MNQYFQNSMFKRNKLYDENEQMKKLREQGLLNIDSLESTPTNSYIPQSVQATIDASKQGSNFPGSGMMAGEAAGQPKQSSGSGMGTEDWVGLGLQAYGALRADKEADAEQKRIEEKERELLARQGVKDRQQAQLTEEEMQMQRRQQNMGGLQYLANQRADAMKNRTAFSFRSNLAKALRG